MNTARTSRLFIADTSIGPDCLILPETHKRYGRLISKALRRRLKSQEEWEILGRTLLTICHYAHAARRIEVLREASDFVASIPVRNELRAIGEYYRGQVLLRTGEIDAARIAFEKLATHPEFPWKPRAIVSIGTCHYDAGDLDTATPFYLEAQRSIGKTGADLLTWLKSQWMIAVIRSRQDDHKSTLPLLESIEPLVCRVGEIHGAIYYDYLNSLAVEHIALNHLDEAERLIRITLGSPCAKNFPYFYDTRDEITEKREAAAATLFVNIDILPRTQPTLLQQKTADPDSDMDAHARGVRESDKNLDPESKPDLTCDLTAEAESVKPESKPQSKPRIHRNRVLEVRTAIIVCSSYRKSAQSLPLPGMPPLPGSVGVPDNRRPRSPPNHSKQS